MIWTRTFLCNLNPRCSIAGWTSTGSSSRTTLRSTHLLGQVDGGTSSWESTRTRVSSISNKNDQLLSCTYYHYKLKKGSFEIWLLCRCVLMFCHWKYFRRFWSILEIAVWKFCLLSASFGCTGCGDPINQPRMASTPSFLCRVGPVPWKWRGCRQKRGWVGKRSKAWSEDQLSVIPCCEWQSSGHGFHGWAPKKLVNSIL